MTNEDRLREDLSDAKARLITLEQTLPPNLADMTPRTAWELYCVIRDIEVAGEALAAHETSTWQRAGEIFPPATPGLGRWAALQ